MAQVDFREPLKVPAIGFWDYVRSLRRIGLYRSLPLRWSLRLACFLRRFEMFTHPERREQITDLLRPLLPENTSRRQVQKMTRLSRAIRRVGASTYAPVSHRSPQWLLKTFQPEGLNILEEAKRAGRGAIVLGSHVGMNDWVGPILIQLGYPVHLMQRRVISTEKLLLLRWDNWVARVLPYPDVSEAGIHLKWLHDLIRQGRWIQHTADSADPTAGLTGTFLGRQVRCCRAPWALGRLTGAPLLLVLALVDGRMRVRFHVSPPIYVENGPSPKDSMRTAFQVYLDFLSSRLAGIPWNLSHQHLAAITV